jgi:hypothetical protein
MASGHSPQQLSHYLQWWIEEIPGEDGWSSEAAQREFEQTALALVSQGIPEETVLALLKRMYWTVANIYGG